MVSDERLDASRKFLTQAVPYPTHASYAEDEKATANIINIDVAYAAGSQSRAHVEC